MADVIVDLKGLEALQRELTNFPQRVARNILARSVYAGAVVVRDEARKLAPVGETGKLKKSIRIRKRRSRRGVFEAVYAIGPAVYYGHLVEYGTKAHLIKRVKAQALQIGGHYAITAHHPGATGKPFLRPAFDNNTPRIIEAMRAKMREGIEREYVRQAIHGRA